MLRFCKHLLAVCVLFASLACAAEPPLANQGNKMSPHNTYFGLLKQPVVINPANNNGAIVQLENFSDKLILLRNEERYDMWSDWLRDAYDERTPVYVVARKQDGVIQDIRVASLRRIDSLVLSTDKQQLKVGMLPSPSYYHVSVTHPRFKDIQETLQRSLDNQKQVYIVPGGPLEILDVRVPDPNWLQRR